MSGTMDASQLRIAEKLIILNDRAIGMLTRMYNIKKACSDANSKPKFLNDKSIDAAINIIVKKFPIVDMKKNSHAFVNVEAMKQDITRNLSLYYYTFADLLDLKDHILQLLTTMDANQCKLDITLNYDLTAGYLNLVVNYISLMILLSRVDDRKAVLGLFNAAYDFSHGHAEPSFPRLGQMIIDYENPIRKLAEDLGPLYRLINSALSSLREIYFRRNISAAQQREAQMISLIANPKQLLFAAQTNTVACEYLSLDVMDRWIILGVTVCHNTMLHDESLYTLYQRALHHGVSLRLFRDEYILIYPLIQGFFETIKGYSKKCQEIKELYLETINKCRNLHAHRREFLRTALKELVLLIKDQPGLLGPKILFVWMGLSYARDEILWLLRHIEIWPIIAGSKKAKDASATTIGDKNMHELLFYMIELRELVLRYTKVIARYHTEYISGYDAIALDEVMQNLKNLQKDDYLLISSCVDSAAKIKTENLNLIAMRLDWFRFQAHVSAAHSPFQLSAYRELAVMMNTMVFHSKMVDLIPEMIKETSDLSIYCFYKELFDEHLKQCLNIAIQSRYSISYAFIAAQFVNSLHDMCPEERDHIIERGLICSNMVLDELVRKTGIVFSQLTHEELMLEQKLSPEACGQLIAIAYANQNATLTKNQQPIDLKMPGYESIRTNREDMTDMDKCTTFLIELCSAVGYAREIVVSEHIFAPKEYLSQHLERHLMHMVMTFLKPNDFDTPKRPSEMLTLLTSVLDVLQTANNAMNFDLTRFFNDMMLQQSQGLDCHGKETLASTYTRWYLEVLLRRASSHHIVYSDHLKSFIGINESTNLTFAPERYTDMHELRCLTQLIGPYGIKFMAERLTWHIASQITEMNKLVKDHKELLHLARINFDKPDKMRDLTHQLSTIDLKEKRSTSSDKSSTPIAGSPIDSIIQRITIIGEIVAFRNLLFAALKDVIDMRLPFLTQSLKGLIDISNEFQKIDISEMSAATGVETDVDLALVNAIQAQAQTHRLTDADEHYTTSCLLMVFIAISLPKLATMKQSFFKATYIAAPNNCHAIPLGITTIGGALFYLHQRGDIPERMREFLALASSVLLQLAGTSEKDKMPNMQSVYILIEKFVEKCSWLNYTLLESCFPYTLIRSAYSNCYQKDDRAI